MRLSQSPWAAIQTSTTWWLKQCSHCSGLWGWRSETLEPGGSRSGAEGLPPACRRGLMLCPHVSLHGGESSAALSRGTGSVRSGPHPVSHLTVTSSLEAQLQHGHVGLGLQHVQWGLRPRDRDRKWPLRGACRRVDFVPLAPDENFLPVLRALPIEAGAAGTATSPSHSLSRGGGFAWHP